MTMTFAEWSTLVRHHDLTFAYSDDNSVWRRGQAVLDLIRAESVNFPPADCARVWNEMVDSFLIPEARAPFYWHQPPDNQLEVSRSEREEGNDSSKA